MYLSTCIVLTVISIGWAVYMELLIHYVPDIEIRLSFFEALRKLFNYPKIYQAILKPIIIEGVLYEFVIAFIGVITFLLIAIKNIDNKTLSSVPLLILLIFLAIGIGKSIYSDIRYFYFTYPLLLLYSALLAVTLYNVLQPYAYGKTICVAAIAIFLLSQFLFSWKTISAEVGSEKPFSYAPIYFDYRTCGTYLQENRSDRDYVVAFASAHQSAVYCGTINACYRPHLMEHQGDFHYITGSKYIDTKEDLKTYITENTYIKNIWIIFSKDSFRNESWEYGLIEKIEAYTVCEAMDNNIFLIKVSPFDLLKYLE